MKKTIIFSILTLCAFGLFAAVKVDSTTVVTATKIAASLAPATWLKTIAIILGVLVAFEQLLASIPAIKANSTFQLIANICNWIASGFKGGI